MVSNREVERVLRTIFRRCVQCPTGTPSCPSCGHNQICSLTPQSCGACAHAECIANPSPAPPTGPNVGAIAGGVIGGVVLMAVVMILLWRFWIKKRREQQEIEAEEWAEDDIAAQKAGIQFNRMRHHDAASVRTRASFANSILSRASNIIQIAYIPGVTNRNGSSHNSLAPVPPVPAAYAQSGPKSPLSSNSDALFFRPESTWSDSSMRSGNRDTQYTRQSITPSLARSSIASEIFRDDAASHPMPAMPVARGIPRMVSVKGASSVPSTPGTPPTSSDGQVKVMVAGQSLSPSIPSSRSAGSFGRATQVTVGGKGRFPVRNADDTSSASSKHIPLTSSPLVEHPEEDTEEEEDDDHKSAAQRSLLGNTSAVTTPIPTSPAPSAQTIESPFFDASETPETVSAPAAVAIPPPPRANPYAAMSSSVGTKADESRKAPPRGTAKSVGGLSAVIEEASRRGSDSPPQSPFGDEHAAH